MWDADARGFESYDLGNPWRGNPICLFTNCKMVRT